MKLIIIVLSIFLLEVVVPKTALAADCVTIIDEVNPPDDNTYAPENLIKKLNRTLGSVYTNPANRRYGLYKLPGYFTSTDPKYRSTQKFVISFNVEITSDTIVLTRLIQIHEGVIPAVKIFKDAFPSKTDVLSAAKKYFAGIKQVERFDSDPQLQTFQWIHAYLSEFTRTVGKHFEAKQIAMYVLEDDIDKASGEDLLGDVQEKLSTHVKEKYGLTSGDRTPYFQGQLRVKLPPTPDVRNDIGKAIFQFITKHQEFLKANSGTK